MADIKIEDRSFVNDNGELIKFKRLVVRGVIQGEIQAVELPINKEQALLVGMLLKSTEQVTEATTVHQPYVSKAKNEELQNEAKKAEQEQENQEARNEFQQGFSI